MYSSISPTAHFSYLFNNGICKLTLASRTGNKVCSSLYSSGITHTSIQKLCRAWGNISQYASAVMPALTVSALFLCRKMKFNQSFLIFSLAGNFNDEVVTANVRLNGFLVASGQKDAGKATNFFN